MIVLFIDIDMIVYRERDGGLTVATTGTWSVAPARAETKA